MASPATSLVWADGQIFDGEELPDQVRVDLGRLLGMSPVVYLNGPENLETQIEVLLRSAAVLGYTGLNPAAVESQLNEAFAALPDGCVVAALIPGPSSHKAAPPGDDWFLVTDSFEVESSNSELKLAFSPNPRNHHGPVANVLLLDDLELGISRLGPGISRDLRHGAEPGRSRSDMADALIHLNLDGRVACVDQSALVISEDGSEFTPPLIDGAIETGWRRRAVLSGRLVEARISPQRILDADRVACLTPWGRYVTATSVVPADFEQATDSEGLADV